MTGMSLCPTTDAVLTFVNIEVKYIVTMFCRSACTSCREVANQDKASIKVQ